MSVGLGTPKPRVDYRSVSQYNTFARCAYRYRLERIDRAWQRPASWLSQGVAVHAAMEAWEKSGREMSLEALIDVHDTEFIKSVEEQAKTTPNFDYWFGSGPYDGPTDIERRFGLGREQIEKLTRWATEHPDEKVWITPDGEPAVEVEFFEEMGGVKVKGFIDLVLETPEGLVVRDYKTGAKPGDAFQLTVYAEALRLKYGVDVVAGDFMMGKTGKPTIAHRITDEDRKAVHEGFEWLEKKIQAGEYEPSPSKSNCTMCAVRTACEFAEY
ncbi:PD-(D/E)XK nuclease family protein [Corynebacterium coyleae]|uniref:RecB family exonuclease n=1 Tax=Corynebacterium coyleae TaxID=53374 RepID=UPI001CCE1B27|nr:PD-(D/E)XK nuclease family protein [Corynebacterium coyleae]UBI10024.1 PD-(D/E)XK nuclease family protein [Corynebacterium coyleae]